jgi:threonine aldolase
MASLLAERVRDLPGVTVTRPVEANAVFAILDRDAVSALRARYDFYVWDEATSEVRWMCSWDTTEEDVEGFAAAVAEATG